MNKYDQAYKQMQDNTKQAQIAYSGLKTIIYTHADSKDITSKSKAPDFLFALTLYIYKLKKIYNIRNVIYNIIWFLIGVISTIELYDNIIVYKFIIQIYTNLKYFITTIIK